MDNKGRQTVSFALLCVALSLFVTFHFTDAFSHEWGWRVWPDLWRVAQHPKSLDSKLAVILASFLNFSFLIVVSPFLKNVWTKSLLAWWGAVTFSGLAGVVFWVMYFLGSVAPSAVGGWCLMLAPIFNFSGLLLARSRLAEGGIFSSGSGKSAG